MNEQQQRELAAGLRAIAGSTRDARAGRRVEEAVLAEMAAHVAREHVAREDVPREHAREHVAREHVARKHVAREHVAPGTSHVSTWHVSTSHVARRTLASPKRAEDSSREGGSHVAREHVVRRTFFPIAASLVLAVGGALWMAHVPSTTREITPLGFVSLPDAAALPQIESASIVRVSLPVAALPVYGVAILPDVRTDSVEAELLVAQDGQPRAIRLVNDSHDSRSADHE